jgi:four helix bundle suffix protein
MLQGQAIFAPGKEHRNRGLYKATHKGLKGLKTIEVHTRPPEVAANIAICLIHQANYLIDKQLQRLEKDFAESGGLRERMTRVRVRKRGM